MSVTYLIEFQVKPGQLQRFRTLLFRVLDEMRHEATFRNAILHEDPEDPHRLLLHETWADHDDVVENQLAREYRRAWHEALPELLASPRKISTWAPLRADGAVL